MGAVFLKIARVAFKSAGKTEEAIEKVTVDDNSDDSVRD